VADQRAAYGFCGTCEKPVREGATCCPETVSYRAANIEASQEIVYGGKRWTIDKVRTVQVPHMSFFVRDEIGTRLQLVVAMEDRMEVVRG
jgi:hypothetical protein